MEETGKINLKCQECGKEFRCKQPIKPGHYSVFCINPECGAKVKFQYQLNEVSEESQTKEQIKLGRMEDGSYRFICENLSCRKSILVPSNQIKIGHNKVICPKCKTDHEFEIIPTEEDLLKCQTLGCKGELEKPFQGDGIYSQNCNKCGAEYAVIVEDGKVKKVTMKTPLPITSVKQCGMKLIAGNFFGKKEYPLSKGKHYIGRDDNEEKSDFSLKDKYASKKSVRIDVNEHGGNLIYKLTVERASNPVYHNNHELTVGDIIYLTYGDTLKLGKTLIKIKKA